MRDFLEQAGVIPYRLVGSGLEVLLITSRSSGDWIVPKGMVDPGFTPEEAALQEAWEEAGVRGKLGPYLGCLETSKGRMAVRIQLFALPVTEVTDKWLERHYRRRRWFPAKDAISKVRDRELARLIQSLLNQSRLPSGLPGYAGLDET